MKLKVYLFLLLLNQSAMHAMNVTAQQCKGSGWFIEEKDGWERVHTNFLGTEDPTSLLNNPGVREFVGGPWHAGPCPKCESKKLVINGKEIQKPRWTFENGGNVICENSSDDVLAKRYNYPDIVEESVKQNCRDCVYDSAQDTLSCECWHLDTKQWTRVNTQGYARSLTPEAKAAAKAALEQIRQAFSSTQ